MVDNIERLLLEVDAPGIAVNGAVENELIIARIVVLPPPRFLEKRNGFLLEVRGETTAEEEEEEGEEEEEEDVLNTR